LQHNLNAILEQVTAWLRARQEPAWLVGGTVRDGLLGRPVHDIDLVVPEGGLRLAQALADALGAAYFPLDRARDVGRVVIRLTDNTSVVVDVARQRGPTLNDDLFARDFSINAMAWDVHDPARTPIDPVGGQADLAIAQLRVVSAQAFADDPLRIVRGVRLANQFGLTWEPASRDQARQFAARLDSVAGERVRDELVRVFSASRASQGLRQLDDLGALAVLLPEVKALQGITQSPPHWLDVYDHTLLVVDWTHQVLGYLALGGDPDAAHALSSRDDALAGMIRSGFDDALVPFTADLAAYLAQPAEQGLVRRDLLPWAALLHDIAKPSTRQLEPDGRIRFAGHEATGAVQARAVLQRLHFSGEAIQRVTRMIAVHEQPGSLARTSKGELDRRAVYRYFKATQPAGVETALLSLADNLAAWGARLRPERWARRVKVVSVLLNAYFRHFDQQVAPKPLLDGTDLMRELELSPGPTIGAYLAALQEEQAAGAITTTQEAWTFLRALAQQPTAE
jgi:putative nucleotidyltransferase with HDIG domain